MKLFWCSFASCSLPEGKQFLGVAMIEAEDVVDAARNAWKHGCNPGGEMLALEVFEDAPEELVGHLRTMPRHVLLSKERVEEMMKAAGDEIVRSGDVEGLWRLEKHGHAKD